MATTLTHASKRCAAVSWGGKWCVARSELRRILRFDGSIISRKIVGKTWILLFSVFDDDDFGKKKKLAKTQNQNHKLGILGKKRKTYKKTTGGKINLVFFLLKYFFFLLNQFSSNTSFYNQHWRRSHN